MRKREFATIVYLLMALMPVVGVNGLTPKQHETQCRLEPGNEWVCENGKCHCEELFPKENIEHIMDAINQTIGIF
jgi:hypothetical protein